MTTLKLDDSVRDRLRTLAHRHGRTMGEEVAALVSQAEQAELWTGYRDAVAGLSPATRALMEAHQQSALRVATEEHTRATTG